MKRVYIIVLLFFPLHLFSQQVRDVVYLKNQSIIRGKIIEQTGEIIKIKTIGNNIFAYSPNEVFKIESEKYEEGGLKKKGYYNYTTFGALVGNTENERKTAFSFLMEHNYQLNQNLAIGGVVGIELLNETTLPVGLNVKGIFELSKGTQLFLGATGGYSLSLEKPLIENYTVKEASGGILANSEVGIIFSSDRRAGFVVAIGYRYNTLNYVREDWVMQEVERKMIFNRLSLRIGVVLY